MRGIILAALLSTTALTGGCQVNPATGKSQLILVSQQEVSAMGTQARPQLINEYGGEVRSSQLRDYVSQVGRRLVRQVEPEYAELNWNFTTLDSDVINAFALPGGNVFISRGLLERFNNEAQVAAVLAHEIGHVTGRHVDERISRAVATDLALQIGAGLTESQIAVAAGQLFGQGYLLSFGRDQESQADELGLRYMTQAGYDPRGMMQVLQILAEADQGGRQWELFATHPDPERRLRDVQRLIRDRYNDTVNSPDHQLHESRFRRDAAPHLGPPGRAMFATHGVMGIGGTGSCPHCNLSTLEDRS